MILTSVWSVQFPKAVKIYNKKHSLKLHIEPLYFKLYETVCVIATGLGVFYSDTHLSCLSLLLKQITFFKLLNHPFRSLLKAPITNHHFKQLLASGTRFLPFLPEKSRQYNASLNEAFVKSIFSKQI